MLELMNVHRYFGDVRVLNGVDFRLLKECVNTLIGRNCSGKTVLINGFLRKIRAVQLFICRWQGNLYFLRYNKSIETHQGGRAYYEQMFFIRDGYDSLTSHFHVTLERFMVYHTTNYEEQIRNLKQKYSNSTLFKSEKYYEKTNI
ncbi:MAG: hypothetical protein FWG98_12710 [Candidatus Cloacimonetes bacterium]|nr:hypothetical protein [Candidatus Cloacimonadota bacterium]